MNERIEKRLERIEKRAASLVSDKDPWEELAFELNRWIPIAFGREPTAREVECFIEALGEAAREDRKSGTEEAMIRVVKSLYEHPEKWMQSDAPLARGS